MSFIDDIVDFGKSAIGSLTGGGLGGTILRTAVTGLALNQLTKSTNKSNDNARTASSGSSEGRGSLAEQGVSVSVSASTESKIPVLYGRAVTGGQLFDVRMSNDNNTMHYCYVLSERTGTMLSTNQPSVISFQNIYWSGYKMNFQGDGITVASLEDLQGNLRTNWAGNIKVWCYNNGSDGGVVPVGYSGSVPPAYGVVPGWMPDWQMNQLVFVVVQVNYVRAFNLVGIGNMTFDIENTMRLPGDVLYDISTNTRYGAGIPPEDIRST
jgi:hypothetical protein